MLERISLGRRSKEAEVENVVMLEDVSKLESKESYSDGCEVGYFPHGNAAEKNARL